jgi:hypothetical protein
MAKMQSKLLLPAATVLIALIVSFPLTHTTTEPMRILSQRGVKNIVLVT